MNIRVITLFCCFSFAQAGPTQSLIKNKIICEHQALQAQVEKFKKSPSDPHYRNRLEEAVALERLKSQLERLTHLCTWIESKNPTNKEMYTAFIEYTQMNNRLALQAKKTTTLAKAAVWDSLAKKTSLPLRDSTLLPLTSLEEEENTEPTTFKDCRSHSVITSPAEKEAVTRRPCSAPAATEKSRGTYFPGLEIIEEEGSHKKKNILRDPALGTLALLFEENESSSF